MIRLNLAQCFDFCLGMDFILGHHNGLRTEAFNHGAHVRPDGRRGQQDRRFAFLRKSVISFAHGGNEFLELGRGHGKLSFFAASYQRVAKSLFPLRRQGQQRNKAVYIGVLVADLARQPRADMFGDKGHIFGISRRLGNAFEDGGQVADRYAFGHEVLENALQAPRKFAPE